MNTLDKFRAGHVTRWQIVRTSNRQSVAEHSFNVAMIAEELARRAAVTDDVLRWALYNDLVEVYTGDVPTPMRRALERVHPGIINEVEDGFAPQIAGLREATPLRVRRLVKAADLMEAIWYLKHEGLGDHAARVLQTLQMRLYDLMAELSPEDPSLYGAIVDLMAEIDPTTCTRERFVV